jgi:hypothetical protein
MRSPFQEKTTSVRSAMKHLVDGAKLKRGRPPFVRVAITFQPGEGSYAHFTTDYRIDHCGRHGRRRGLARTAAR